MQELTGRELDAAVERYVFGRDVGEDGNCPQYSDPTAGWQYVPLIVQRIRQLRADRKFVSALSGSLNRTLIDPLYAGLFDLFFIQDLPDLVCQAAIEAVGGIPTE